MRARPKKSPALFYILFSSQKSSVGEARFIYANGYLLNTYRVVQQLLLIYYFCLLIK